MFAGSQNLVVTGGTFTMTGEFHTHNHIITPAIDDGREGLRLLQQKISLGAFHNSEERYDPPKCHPRTREAILNKIMDWVKDPEKLACFLWLYGPAGAGKSAIAQTIAEMCHQLNLLAAAFFFSRTAAGRDNKTSLILTLVYQLATCIPELRGYVGKALERNPALLSMSLKAQMKALFIDALNSIAEPDNAHARPRFFIVDGLDECGDPESQEYVLQVLSEGMAQLSTPVFFLVASRPEQQIRDAFNEDLLASLATTIVLDDTFKPDNDIQIFLDDKFQVIKRKHPSRARFPIPWPSSEDIKYLVEKSSGQFIYAATVMKYVESRRHLPPDRLQIIVNLTSPGNDTPFAALDALYLHIFGSVGDLNKVKDLFYVLLYAEENTVEKIPAVIERFLFYRPGEIDIILSELPSILAIPSPGEPSAVLRISHASLSDFLVDRSRSGRFFIDAGAGYARITTLILKHLALEPENIRQHTSSLFDHGPKAHSTDELLDALREFNLGNLLNWLSDDVTLKRGNGPIVFWSKAPLDDRWPNIPRFLFWLQKHYYFDSTRDMGIRFVMALDTWLYTQLANYPQMPGTKYLLTSVAFKDLFQEFYTEIFDLINDGVNWDPNDVSDMKHVDPIHFFDTYQGVDYSKYYYDAIADFLTDKARSKEYYVDEDQYAAFVKLLINFILPHFLETDTTVWRPSPNFALAFLPQALARSSKTHELMELLEMHVGTFACSDPENDLYAAFNTAADAMRVYLTEYVQSK